MLSKPTRYHLRPAQSASAISGLALLKVQWDRKGTTYIDNFLPFVRHCVAESSDDPISTSVVQACITESFGLRLPQHAIRLLLTHAARKGWLVAENRTFVRSKQLTPDARFEQLRDQVANDHAQLVTELRSFALSRGHEWSEEQASSALLATLARGREEFLAHSGRNLILPRLRTSRDDTYVAAQFVSQALVQKTASGVRLDHLFRGLLLAHALYLPDPSQANRRFKDTAIYFDTPFLLEGLGCRGSALQALRQELLQLLYDTGATLHCFRATVEECRGALNACASAMRNPRIQTFGPTAASVQHFISAGLQPSDVDLIIATIEQRLKELRIAVSDYPHYSEYRLVIDEPALSEAIHRHLPSARPPAVKHDVDAVAAILRSREGHRSRFAEDCRAVFVTTNRDLARVVRAFFRSESAGGYLPPCVTDFTLTNLLWLKAPTLSPALPQLQLIADSYALVQPTDALWDQYVAEITRLRARGDITEDDYYLLRYQYGAREALMQTTHAGMNILTEGSIDTILSEIRLSIADGERKRRLDAEQQLDIASATENLRRQRVRRTTDRLAFVVSRGLTVVLPLTASVVIAILSAFQLWAGILLGIATAVALTTGWSFLTLGRKVEAALRRRLFVTYCRFALLSPDARPPERPNQH